jgi:hypothetical protein
MTTLEAATAWGISCNEVTRLCRAGRVPGITKRIDNAGQRVEWILPADAKKPTILPSGRPRIRPQGNRGEI